MKHRIPHWKILSVTVTLSASVKIEIVRPESETIVAICANALILTVFFQKIPAYFGNCMVLRCDFIPFTGLKKPRDDVRIRW